MLTVCTPPHPGLCAGKRAVATFLVDVLEFTEVVLAEQDCDGQTPDTSPNPGVISFDSAQDLVDYITPRWTERFVLTGIRDMKVLDELSTRPFFILVGVDAPVHVRWARCMKRLESIDRFAGEQDLLKVYLYL